MVDSVEEVASMMAAGLAAGGTEPTEMRDDGFMQQRTVEDFDGHTWKVFNMDVSKFPAQQPAEQQTAMGGHVKVYSVRIISFSLLAAVSFSTASS